jgi:hypothetical protein
MVTRSFDRHAVKSIRAVYTSADFDLTAANTTAQAVQVGSIPANAFVINASAVNTGATVAGPTAFNVTMGTASGGTQYFTAVDLITAASGNTVNTVIDVAQTQTVVYAGFAPTVANWNAITNGSSMQFTVTVLYVELDGDDCR